MQFNIDLYTFGYKITLYHSLFYSLMSILISPFDLLSQLITCKFRYVSSDNIIFFVIEFYFFNTYHYRAFSFSSCIHTAQDIHMCQIIIALMDRRYSHSSFVIAIFCMNIWPRSIQLLFTPISIIFARM